MTRTKTLGLAFVALLLSPLAANATIMTFNGTAPDGGFTGFASGATYSEGGYTMTSLTGGNFFIDNDFTGDLAGFDDDVVDLDSIGSSVRFTANGGGAFNAIDLLVAQANAPGSLQIVGFFAGGGSITIDALGCGLGCIDLVDLSAFRRLSSLEITTTAQFMVFDDLKLIDVPEPGTLLLLGLGLAGLGFGKRRNA